MNSKLNYKHHKIYFEKPEKCRRPIGAKECNSKKFLKHDSFVKLRGVLCTHYKCKKCNADYFVAVKNQPNENLQISELKEMEGVGNRMKGGHRRNAIYNAFHRIIFRSKNARQIDPTQKQE